MSTLKEQVKRVLERDIGIVTKLQQTKNIQFNGKKSILT